MIELSCPDHAGVAVGGGRDLCRDWCSHDQGSPALGLSPDLPLLCAYGESTSLAAVCAPGKLHSLFALYQCAGWRVNLKTDNENGET